MDVAIKSIAAGTLSGWASILVCYPFDNVRTRLQTENFGMTLKDCLKSVYRSSGILGFYKGFSGPFLAQGVYKAVIFSTNSLCLSKFSDGSFISSFISGMTAGSVNALVVCPVELLRNQQLREKSKNSSSSGLLHCARSVFEKNSFFGFFRGLSLTVARDGIGLGLYFITYKFVKTNLPDSIFGKLIAGSSAGIIFWVAVLPLDTMKSMIQSADLGDRITVRKIIVSLSKSSLRDCMARLYGSLPVAVARGIPGAAITLTTYDVAYQYLSDVKIFDDQ